MLNDVKYILDLEENLILMGELDSIIATNFGKSSWKIVKGVRVIARDTKS